jgi:hypothetical protein
LPLPISRQIEARVATEMPTVGAVADALADASRSWLRLP